MTNHKTAQQENSKIDKFKILRELYRRDSWKVSDEDAKIREMSDHELLEELSK